MASPARWRSYAPYAAAVLMALIAKLPTLNNNILFVDEPLYLAQARRLDSPGAFIYSFQHVTETKFPLSIAPHIAAQLISQPNAVFVLRLFGLAAVIASACLIIVISRLAFGSVAPGFFAVATWVLFLNKYVMTAATDLEYFQVPLILLGVWLFIKGLQYRWRRNAYLLCCGISIGLATLVKPPAILITPMMLPVLLYYTSIQLGQTWQSSIKSMVALCLGLAIPLAIFGLPYFLRPDTLPELRFNLLENAGAYSDLHHISHLVRLLILLANFQISSMIIIVSTAVQYLVSRFIFHRREWNDTDVYELLVLLTGGVLLVGYVVGQVKTHYMVAIMPPLMLFAGHRLWLLWKSLPRQNLRVVFILALGLFIAVIERDTLQFYAELFTDDGKLYAQQMPTVNTKTLSDYVKANSRSQDSIWVYYNAPEVYWLADRKPATSDPTGSWITQLYTPFWFERMYDELAHEQPALIIGIDEPRYRENVASLTELPRVKELLARRYDCEANVVANTIICKYDGSK